MPLSPLLAGYDQVILDLDGCVWLGDQPTPRVADAIVALREHGLPLAFVTNDSHHSPEEYVRKLWSLGCTASLEEVVTVGAALQHLLAGRARDNGAFVIGSEAIFRHVSASGHRILNNGPLAEVADVVVVAGHESFDYRQLRTATRAVLAGAEMIATDRDPTYPTADGISPGSGAVLAALEYATGRRARSIGKPNTELFETALARLGDGNTLVIGDRLDADLAGAAAAGLDGAIVLTGVTSRADAEAATDPVPVAVAPDLATLVLSG